MVSVGAVAVTLGRGDMMVLRRVANGQRSAHRDVVRARIVLAAGRGETNCAIAAAVRVHVDTVRKWRRRFAERGLAGLGDRARSGRPRWFTPVQVAEVKALACEPPDQPPDHQAGKPLSRWSVSDLAGEAVERGVVASISQSTVRRWLSSDAIKPWQHRSWIFARDPQFAVKAARVLDLYARTCNGEPLGEHDYVISADEKSQLQALRRRHPTTPPRSGRPARVEFEYSRGGTLAYLAA